MRKSKISMTKIVQYLRELSIIITGIIITVGFGLWVNKNNIRKDQKLYLYAIILELKENAESFETYTKRLQKCVGYSNYIRSHDEKSINQDSIQFYASSGPDNFYIGWGNSNPVTLYNQDAFEMFKSSGIMHQISDKELLLSIWKLYQLMKHTQNEIDDNLRYKRELAMNDRQRIDNGEEVALPKKWFYINEIPRFMVMKCEQVADIIRETISKLEESKIF